MSDDQRDRNVERDLGQDMAEAIEALSAGRSGVEWVQRSFQHAAAALGAERGYLVRVGVRREVVEVVASCGVSAHAIRGLRLGYSPPGLSTRALTHVLDSGQTLLIEDTRRDSGVEGTRAFLGGACSVVCAPVLAAETSVPLAALYFETRSLQGAFTPDVVPHVEVYAAALAQAWKRSRLGADEQPCVADELQAARAALVPGRVEILGDSASTMALRHRLRHVITPALAAAQADPVLILGPTGSGKEVVARYLHALSARGSRRFLGLNCATFKGEILEAKLFGHTKGAFTGATGHADGLFVLAHGGVLFLDEVGDMPEEGQVMLLRALETRSIRPVGGREERVVDVQVFCATNVDLEDAVKRGRFRSDLYHRINGLTVRLAALRDRREDIQPLLLHYLAYHEQRLGRRCVGPSREALDLLCRYDWPGNVRELNRACSALVLHVAEGGLIDAATVSLALPQVCAQAPEADAPVMSSEPLLERRYTSFQEAQDTFARAYFATVYRRCRGNRAAMAREMRLSRSQFYRYAVRYGYSGGELGEKDAGWGEPGPDSREGGSDGWND